MLRIIDIPSVKLGLDLGLGLEPHCLAAHKSSNLDSQTIIPNINIWSLSSPILDNKGLNIKRSNNLYNSTISIDILTICLKA